MISVVIPTKNEAKNIEHCLVSLIHQNFKGKYEVILVDGFSTDGTIKYARKHIKKIYQYSIHKQVPRGPAAARNYGAKLAKYPIVAFIDADCIAREDWLERIWEDFQKDEQLVGVGGILAPRDARIVDIIMFTLFSDWWVKISSWLGIWQLYGNNCAYRRSAFLKQKGFSTTISFWEDTELSMRMKNTGKLLIDRNMVVWTSTRRFRQKGYGSVFMINLKAFIDHLLGRPITERYFEEIKH